MSLKSMFDFSAVKSDEDGMRLASRFDRATAAVVEDLTCWIHSIAVRYNDPKKPMLAAKAFEEYMMTLQQYITSEEAGEDRWIKSNGHSSDFSLTGNSNVANAYKRTYNAIKLGGDLVGLDSKFDYGNELTTASRCMKFATKRNAQIKKDGEEKQAVEELHQLIEEELGLERGTAEHEAEFAKRSMTVVDSSGDSEPSSDSATHDVYSKMGQEYADKLRELAEAGESLPVIEQMFKSAVDRLAGTISKVRSRLNKAA